MEQLDVIKWLVAKLEENSIPYFITGSIASAYYGIPRFTHDIDLVVNVRKEDADRLVALFIHDGYISKEGIINAFAGTGMFNFIHDQTGWKVDFWISQGDAFALSCFSRARQVEIYVGFYAVMATAEDVLLHKVYWHKLTPSERQLGDARGIVAVQGECLDGAYIKKWSQKMGIAREIEQIMTGKDLPNLT
ncbi:MAG: hypothetical protein FD159_2046 [Syntrophaceae bacterium]|nr:MAG: hypothetical protein FD159_2046 [Syntrophaceae bacterium]